MLKPAVPLPNTTIRALLGDDLTNCDSAPIHIPGSIQPHGILLVVDGGTQKILAGAGHIETLFAPVWLERKLGDLLGAKVAAALDADPVSATIALGRAQGITGPFEIVAYRADNLFLIELEPAPPDTPTAVEVFSQLELATIKFERATDLATLCDIAAKVFRNVTGFDRIMVYRFLDDEAGIVVSEDSDPALSSFLNHHFPASDIPQQARALFMRNRVRVIPNVHYEPAPLRPQSPVTVALDMSDIALRSIFPVHLQYLANMGVAASASIAIVKEGVLWGMVGCHNATPRFLPNHARLICRSIVGSLARAIKAMEDGENYRERIRLRNAEDAILRQVCGDSSLAGFFSGTGNTLYEMFNAHGFAAVRVGATYVVGRVPPEGAITEIAAYVLTLATALPVATHCLTHWLATAGAYHEIASGVLAVVMATEPPTVLLWFRAEQIEVVNWAGNPHKGTDADANAELTPRTSFENWSESIRGCSAPWTTFEIEAAARLRRGLFEARQNHRIAEVNRELGATIADKDALLVQKDLLIREVDHRVQNSLQLVSAFLQMQSRAVNDPVLAGHLAEAQRRLAAVAMVHRRLHSDDQILSVDLSHSLRDLCTEIKSTMDPAWSDQITLDLAPILVSPEHAINLGLILTELIMNANKYAYGGGPGPIAISLAQHRNRFLLIVTDSGLGGSHSTREGFGKRMLKAMVRNLSGTLEETDNQPGLRIVINAPI